MNLLLDSHAFLWAIGDPQLIVWQALRGSMTLVSRDRAMAAYQPHGLALLW